ncbi:MlaD family protein [Azospirillum halopraeferens]|uniref:MlaD family protein n=1 Tax=Azospirillum halopraeferens TaxID=34010 RepID=UPI00041600D3|nr:MlaD family protein [Azospirillum halopraeferens]
METRASYILVGVFVLSLIAGLFVFTVWIAKSQFDEQRDPYLIYFTGSVTGLQEGSPVRYRGIPIGTVTDLRLDPSNVGRVRVAIAVQAGTPIKADSIASLEVQGITGGAYVQITGGTERSELLRASQSGVPVIPSRPSSLAEVVDAAPQILNRVLTIAERIDTLLSPANQQAVTAILANVGTITADVAAATSDLETTAAEARAAMAGARHLTETLSGTVDGLAPDLHSTLEQARRTLATLDRTTGALAGEVTALTRSLTVTSGRVGELVEENREPLRDFTATGLYEVTLLVTQLRDLSSQLSRVVTRIESSPTNFLFGGTRQGVEVGR